MMNGRARFLNLQRGLGISAAKANGLFDLLKRRIYFTRPSGRDSRILEELDFPLKVGYNDIYTGYYGQHSDNRSWLSMKINKRDLEDSFIK